MISSKLFPFSIRFALELTIILCSVTSFAQTKEKKSFYIQPEYQFGKIIAISSYNDSPPKIGNQNSFALNFGFSDTDTTKWRKYYNQAETGIMLLYSNLGNNKVLGHQIGALSFISFRVFNKLNNPLKLKMGAGISYFTHKFDSVDNFQNELIGASFTWDVKVFLYQSIYKNKNFNLQLGIGFSHESNGHTKLPNLGINSPMISLSGQFYNSEDANYYHPQRRKRANISPKNYFFTIRQGIGIHEQDETEGPKMGIVKPVYSSSVSSSILFNNHIKLRAGFTYRFYQHYYDHIIDSNVVSLINNPKWNASNISFFLGNEFLMGHVSIDAELGFNLHKPFYRTFNPKNDIALVMQKLLLTRIGMNLYMINTHKMPKHNIFLGVHIKANNVKADYTEFTLGYSYKLN